MRVKNFILGLIVTAVLNGIPQPFPGRVLPVYDSRKAMTALDAGKILDAILGVKSAYAGPQQDRAKQIAQQRDEQQQKQQQRIQEVKDQQRQRIQEVKDQQQQRINNNKADQLENEAGRLGPQIKQAEAQINRPGGDPNTEQARLQNLQNQQAALQNQAAALRGNGNNNGGQRPGGGAPQQGGNNQQRDGAAGAAGAVGAAGAAGAAGQQQGGAAGQARGENNQQRGGANGGIAGGAGAAVGAQQGGNGGNQQQLAALQQQLQTKQARQTQLRAMMMSGDPAFDNTLAAEYAALNDSIPNLQAQIAAMQNSNGNNSSSGGGTLTVSTGATSATISSGGSAPFTCAQAGTFPVQIINQGPNGYTRSTTVNVVCTQCGNGAVEPGEVCDDGVPLILPDGSMVSQNSCGNALAACDTAGPMACKRCVLTSCTNGIRQWSDGACDTLGGPPCANPSQICTPIDGIGIQCACVDQPRCGDGIKNGTDQCDTANNAVDQCLPGSTCDAPTCTCKPNCGNGKIDMNVNGVNEGCDPLPANPPNPACPANQVCYDPAGGMQEPPAGGNTRCTCVPEYCGDRQKTGDEQCDLGFACPNDPITNKPGNCMKPKCECVSCGNGKKEAGEDCDPPEGNLDAARGETCDNKCKKKQVCPPTYSRCYETVVETGVLQSPNGENVNSNGNLMHLDANGFWELGTDGDPGALLQAAPNDGLPVGADCTAFFENPDDRDCRYRNGVCAKVKTQASGHCEVGGQLGFRGLMCNVITCNATSEEVSVADMALDGALGDPLQCQEQCDNRCNNGRLDLFEQCDNGPNPNNDPALRCTNPKECNAQCKCVNPPPPAENLAVNPGGNVIRGFANA